MILLAVTFQDLLELSKKTSLYNALSQIVFVEWMIKINKLWLSTKTEYVCGSVHEVTLHCECKLKEMLCRVLPDHSVYCSYGTAHPFIDLNAMPRESSRRIVKLLFLSLPLFS